jgi:hypothetical protein
LNIWLLIVGYVYLICPGYDSSRGQILSVSKLELGRSLGNTMEGDGHEVEVTPNLEYLVVLGRA